MSFNIRFDNDMDGVNSWSNRKQSVINLINRYKPGIICMQEATIN